MTRTRYAFVSRAGSVAYVAVTYDQAGANLPLSIDGNEVIWARIEASEGEIFSLFSKADMERDLHEAASTLRRPGRNRDTAGPIIPDELSSRGCHTVPSTWFLLDPL